MATLRERLRRVAGDRSSAIVGVFIIGLVVLGILLSGIFGDAPTAQVIVTLLAPATVMVLYWLAARARLLQREAQFEATLELERVTNRTTAEFLAGVSHELVPHREPCSLRAEASAVAGDYQQVRPDLKVVVPDIVLVTDRHLLREILHILVGNALRHGGHRVALWAGVEQHQLRLTVSDDGPGLAPEVGGRVFDRFVDLASLSGRGPGSGLPLAQSLGELLGGQMIYKRDPSWTHFSIRLPLEASGSMSRTDRVPLEAGVS